ncbi:hypothetical protein AURDEDRAFT_183822 [Auricularia subglabra TFB-10046 SS5]|nr:hypothetical protein AURDEDRAFT_183822 [Auricularia subglabra TFB-10046 SS5]
MASTKKLSNGTLSLRFMQNAKTLQKLRQEPSEPAKVQHEAEWTVPGYRPATSIASAGAISYESSYMPFLYESQAGSSTPVRASGRRVFKHGKELDKSEILTQPMESVPKPIKSEDEAEDDEPSAPSSPPRQRKKTKTDSKGEQATAVAPPKPTRQPLPQAAGFLRPGGVDAPPPVAGRKLGSVAAALLEKKPKREAEDSVSLPPQTKKRKTDIVERATQHCQGVEQTVQELRTEVAVWKRAYDSLKAAEDQKSPLEGRGSVTVASSAKFEASPLVLCLIDADVNLFAHDLLQDGEAGGARAAGLIHQNLHAVAEQGATVWVVVALNKAAASDQLVTGNICSSEQFEVFCSGFNGAFPLFSIVDVGGTPHATHMKVQEYLRTFTRMPSIRRVFLCGHPDRSYRVVLRLLQNDNTISKLVILEGTRRVPDELSRIPTRKIPNLFHVDTTSSTSPASKPSSAVEGYSFDSVEPGAPGLASPLSAGGTNAFSWRSTNNQPYNFTPPSSGLFSSPAGNKSELDPNLPISKQDPPPCNWFYLARCNKGADKCPYSHTYSLTREQIEEMRTRAKRSPCMTTARNGSCTSGDRCILGHYCPNGLSCHYLAQGRCKFTGRNMHNPPPQSPA